MYTVVSQIEPQPWLLPEQTGRFNPGDALAVDNQRDPVQPAIDERGRSPGVPSGSQPLDLLGMLSRQIVLLGAIVVDMVQLPTALKLHHRLPRPAPHSSIPLVLPEDWLLSLQWPANPGDACGSAREAAGLGAPMRCTPNFTVGRSGV